MAGMSIVVVNRDALLAKIKENRDGHRTLFLEAQKGYRGRIIEELERMLADARRGLKVEQYINLPIPEDHTKDYNRVIAMVEMSVEANIELTAVEFSQYVMDEWAWRADFIGTASNYTASAR